MMSGRQDSLRPLLGAPPSPYRQRRLLALLQILQAFAPVFRPTVLVAYRENQQFVRQWRINDKVGKAGNRHLRVPSSLSGQASGIVVTKRMSWRNARPRSGEMAA